MRPDESAIRLKSQSLLPESIFEPNKHGDINQWMKAQT